MNLVPKTVYRIEEVEVDRLRGCVRRQGREHYLRQQAFQVLLYLLSRRQELVSKDELIRVIWNDAAVTDNTLVHCIADIRKALGDDPRQPRLIKTVHKSGYRFIGPVEEVPAPEPPSLVIPALTTAEPPVPEPAPHAEATAEQPLRTPRWPRVIAATLLVAVALGVGARGALRLATAQPALTPPPPGVERIAVLYFDNRSGGDMDWLREGLTDMLITDLTRPGAVEVLSRQQVHALLTAIGHRDGDPVALDQALELARHGQARTLVMGSFVAVGEKVRVDVQIREAPSGRVLAADSLIADRPAQILAQVDALSNRLGGRFHPATAEIDRSAAQSVVMTENLEAYRDYSLGLEKAQAFENAEAVALFEKAIALDPSFAMAYARIGYAYAITDILPERGRPYLEKAFRLSRRLSEKDRLYIAAWYSIARADYPLAIGSFRQIVDRYPFDTEAYYRLARLLASEEQVPDALEVVRRGLVVEPSSKDLHNLLRHLLTVTGNSDEAIAAGLRYVELAPTEPNAHDSLAETYQHFGRYDDAVAEYRRALDLNSRFEPSVVQLADAYFQQGRYKEAIGQYRRYLELVDDDVARAVAHGNIAHVYRMKGDLGLAQQAALAEMSAAPGGVWNTIAVALERGDRRDAERLVPRLFDSGPSPYRQRGAAPSVRVAEYFRGYVALKTGRVEEALAHFKTALQRMPRGAASGIDTYEDCLANAYLTLGRYDEAIAEYERILRLNPLYPLARYHLGQAYEKKGEHETARREYQEFLQVWSRADADIPEMVDARRRLG
jgi:tetratricopeptide (TPR) repeat protein/DNA-binding winged helix-turn-helix (wHTH) protein